MPRHPNAVFSRGPEGGPGQLRQLGCPCYRVHWKWVGTTVQVGQRQGTVEIWAGNERIAVRPRAQRSGKRFILPGQRAGLHRGTTGPARRQWRCQIPAAEVEHRSLDVYELATGGGR